MKSVITGYWLSDITTAELHLLLFVIVIVIITLYFLITPIVINITVITPLLIITHYNKYSAIYDIVMKPLSHGDLTEKFQALALFDVVIDQGSCKWWTENLMLLNQKILRIFPNF